LARDIVLQNPDHIVVIDCPCRAAKENPCLPLDVCLIVGEPFAGFVLDHHPEKSRKITSEEAQNIIKAEDERGHVHHAFFKDAMLGRFYAICNCCSCCCGAMAAQRNGTPMLASSGYLAKIDQENCMSCGKCIKTCQFNAISKNGKISIDETVCMGCGVCVNQCRYDAIHLVRAESKGIPLEIHNLMSQT
jgi:Pyruvate/2-oxoacid:ferredoxin oxidoreductase delta subunit